MHEHDTLELTLSIERHAGECLRARLCGYGAPGKSPPVLLNSLPPRGVFFGRHVTSIGSVRIKYRDKGKTHQVGKLLAAEASFPKPSLSTLSDSSERESMKNWQDCYCLKATSGTRASANQGDSCNGLKSSQLITIGNTRHDGTHCWKGTILRPAESPQK